MTLSNLSNYQLSKDYGALYELAQKQSVVCIVDYLAVGMFVKLYIVLIQMLLKYAPEVMVTFLLTIWNIL